MVPGHLQKRIFNIKSTIEFNECALEIFNYQYNNNAVYNNFINSLGQGSLLKSELLTKYPFCLLSFSGIVLS